MIGVALSAQRGSRCWRRFSMLDGRIAGLATKGDVISKTCDGFPKLVTW